MEGKDNEFVSAFNKMDKHVSDLRKIDTQHAQRLVRSP